MCVMLRSGEHILQRLEGIKWIAIVVEREVEIEVVHVQVVGFGMAKDIFHLNGVSPWFHFCVSE
jgi:hypothetical protein